MAALAACIPTPRDRAEAHDHPSFDTLLAAPSQPASRTRHEAPEPHAVARGPGQPVPDQPTIAHDQPAIPLDQSAPVLDTSAPPSNKPATPLDPPVHASITPPVAPPDSWPPRPPARTEPFELTFVGDVILGRYREDGFDPIPKGGHEIFAEVRPLLRSDLVVGNLETPLAYTLPEQSPVGTRYSFGADFDLARHLAEGGFDVLSLANNHAYDLKADGVTQTPEILAQLGITAVGATRADAPPLRIDTVEREGWRIGFIALTTRANIPSLPGLPPLPLVDLPHLEARIAPLVEDARASHDLVVVLTHWGDEYADEPAWEQQQAARALVEAGADLVIGHHPHVLQGIERHGHGLIAYSLGNFVFENVKEIPRMTGVLRIRYDAAGCLDQAVLHPAFIKSIPIKYPAPATGYMGGTGQGEGADAEPALRHALRRGGGRLAGGGTGVPG